MKSRVRHYQVAIVTSLYMVFNYVIRYSTVLLDWGCVEMFGVFPSFHLPSCNAAICITMTTEESDALPEQHLI